MGSKNTVLTKKYLSLNSNSSYIQKNKKIPSGIYKIIFCNGYWTDESRSFIKNLPAFITSLVLPNFEDRVYNLPNSITHLKFGRYFNNPLNNLPNSITHLILGSDFDQQVNFLPESLVYLVFGYYFNQTVDQLPNSITDLIFGHWFNQPVDKLPNSIKCLTFGYEFNRMVDKLPRLITHLTFGYNFNQPVNELPNLITHLKFNTTFNQSIDSLPGSIVYLYLCGSAFFKSVNNLPMSLRRIELNSNYPLKLLKKIPHGCEVVINDLDPFLCY